MYPDSGWGFLVLKSMESGAPFNYDKSPDSHDISRDKLVFSSWFTPGQYAVPGLIKHALHLNLGEAMTVTVILFNALALLGYWRLYRWLGFDALLSAASLLVIVLQYYFSDQFNFYSGGELLLFGGAPWIIFYSLKNQRMRASSVFIFMGMSLMGFFLKGSYVTCFFAIVLTLILMEIHKFEVLKNKGPQAVRVNNSMITKGVFFYIIRMTAAVAVTCYLIFKLFASKGPNATSVTDFNLNLHNLFFALSGSVFSAFPVDNFLNRIFRPPGHDYLWPDFQAVYFFFALMSCFAGLVIIKEKTLKDTYKMTLIGFFMVYFTFLTVLYFRGAHISYEWRHFRPLGLLFLPGILHLFFRNKDLKASKVFFSLFLIGMSLYGLVEYVNGKIQLKNTQAFSKDGFFQRTLDKEALGYLHQLDESLPHGNNLFYVTSPEMALDIRNNRWMASLADYEPMEMLKGRAYFGTTDHLYLFLQKKFMTNGKEKVILGSFRDYGNFKVISETSCFKVYQGIKG